MSLTARVMFRTTVALAVAWRLGAATEGLAQASYPSRPIRILVGFPPGGLIDVLARTLGERLTVKWGQPCVVDNRPGAAGNLAAEAVAKAEPDGHTLLLTPPTFVINPALYAAVRYDAAEFVPVTVVATVPNLLVVHPKTGASSVRELIDLAKAAPGKLNYSSTGNGGTPHLTGELFKSMAGGVNITHVPYKGIQGLTAVLAGEVDMMFFNLGDLLPHVKNGRLKALGIASSRRIAALPDLPAIAETLPGFESVTWFALVAPPKTPSQLADALSSAIAEALAQPDMVKKLEALMATPLGGTPAQTAAFMDAETARWRRVIVAAGVKVD